MQHSSRHELSDDTALELADTLAARRLYPPEPATVREEWADERDLPLNLQGGSPEAIQVRVVERFGLPQRLLVAPAVDDEDGRYRLLDDPRWLAAAREAGLRRLPIRVLELDPAAADLLTLVLNQQRPANVPAQAAALEPLLDAGLTEEEIGRAAGMKKAQVAKLAKLRRLDPVLRQALSDGAITPATAQAAAELPDLQPELTEDFESEGKLTPAQVRRRADEAAKAAARLAEEESAEAAALA
ncbi:MAG: ParB/RepB/Spo0J family partition protein, partial [Candidatus Dormibacteraeota bacterium]|nr:ParB/RepB/Spo0J family partition protein [Candidatus Dormibacteraeota bacterium]